MRFQSTVTQVNIVVHGPLVTNSLESLSVYFLVSKTSWEKKIKLVILIFKSKCTNQYPSIAICTSAFGRISACWNLYIYRSFAVQIESQCAPWLQTLYNLSHCITKTNQSLHWFISMSDNYICTLWIENENR